MRFIQLFRIGRSWNWHLISFHLMVCVVHRVRPCPLYRVISWLSKHIHFIQASGKVSLWDPLFFHSPPFFCVSLFLTAVLRPVFKYAPPSFPPFIPLSVTFLLTSFSSVNWRRGRRRECFRLSLIFEIAKKLGTSPWCWGVKGQKKTTLSLLYAHTGFNVPVSPCMCAARWSKWVQALRSVKCRFLSRHICVSRYTLSCLGSQLRGLLPLAGVGRQHGPTGGDTRHLQLSRLHLS